MTFRCLASAGTGKSHERDRARRRRNELRGSRILRVRPCGTATRCAAASATNRERQIPMQPSLCARLPSPLFINRTTPNRGRGSVRRHGNSGRHVQTLVGTGALPPSPPGRDKLRQGRTRATIALGCPRLLARHSYEDTYDRQRRTGPRPERRPPLLHSLSVGTDGLRTFPRLRHWRSSQVRVPAQRLLITEEGQGAPWNVSRSRGVWPVVAASVRHHHVFVPY